MKTRLIIVCILIAGGIAIFLTRPARNTGIDAPQPVVREQEASVSEPEPATEIAEAGAPIRTASTSDSLQGAYQTAAFVDQVIASVPRERVATRNHLKGIQALFFTSDYVMAAKVDKSLELSDSAIVAAFANGGQDSSFIRERLRRWAVRPGTLTDHYRAIGENPGAKESIEAIKAALIQNGAVINTESDLLMDCIRYVVHNTDVHEMYGAGAGRPGEATSFPEALDSLVRTGDAVFRHRFMEKFGLSPSAAENLMDQIKGLRLRELSPADVEIPAPYFR